MSKSNLISGFITLIVGLALLIVGNILTFLALTGGPIYGERMYYFLTGLELFAIGFVILIIGLILLITRRKEWIGFSKGKIIAGATTLVVGLVLLTVGNIFTYDAATSPIYGAEAIYGLITGLTLFSIGFVLLIVGLVLLLRSRKKS